MKTILWQSMVMLMLLMVSATLKAQIGIGTNTPDTGVMLEIQSPKKGVLLPRVDDAQSADKVETSLLFDKKTGKFKYYDGKQWLSVNPLNPDVQDNVVAPQDFRAKGDVFVEGDLEVEGNAVFKDSTKTAVLEVSKDVLIKGDLVVNTNAEFVGDLEIKGKSVSAADATIKGLDFVGYGTIPLGGIIMWSGGNIPAGWALCDGKSSNGFVTPDLRGRFIVGYGKDGVGIPLNVWDNYSNPGDLSQKGTKKGSVGGEMKHTLTISEMPKHTHKYSYTPYSSYETSDKHDTDRRAQPSYTRESGSTGGDSPHENRPPYYVLAFIMRVK